VVDAASTRQLLRASGLAAALDAGAWLLGVTGDVPGALREVGGAVQKLLSQLSQGVVVQELGCWLVQWALQVDMLVYHWRGLVTAALKPQDQQLPAPVNEEQQEEKGTSTEAAPLAEAAEGQREPLVEGEADGQQQRQPDMQPTQQQAAAANGPPQSADVRPVHESVPEGVSGP
jgi:hypothetical protein